MLARFFAAMWARLDEIAFNVLFFFVLAKLVAFEVMGRSYPEDLPTQMLICWGFATVLGKIRKSK